MSDDDKSKTDEVAEEAAEETKAEVEEEADEKPAEEAGTQEPEAEEPEADKPKEEAASGDATPAEVDQQGRQLYNVKCSNCGRDTQVPFKPSGDRPVYCRDCYMQKKNS
ncbi:MAG: hypothetical protein UU56_C0003G0034 [Candidatus Curtissbacteria bacterium GW2011_GWA2_41_24]|uniref:CxxC-x17-CxxC domain-containing protein n=1 Tax=Candidatus Curtissbacteria bacterium GW2011_GWA2_41_24 TaxID=1618411 RepID=A0A0G0Y5M6_9BACT|nr:MAG: hypothetical protein UU56_C0003G0034 [Candidatus Curtissbacteria bacterium GW2011_GWA2_41_24]